MSNILHTIWINKEEPSNKDTLWIRPMGKITPLGESIYGIFVYGVEGWTMITASFYGQIAEIITPILNNLPTATEENNGLMSYEDKQKLNSLGVLFGTEEHWRYVTSDEQYRPPKGTIIVYTTEDDQHNITGIVGVKFGTGNACVPDLPFAVDVAKLDQFMEHLSDTSVHVSVADRQRWNNKLNVIDGEEVINDTLILTRI